MNQKLIDYLPDLITHFECVIIPEFGGFISEKTGASINSIGNLQAPKKNILFNQLLNHNDGLLANYIAQKENISYNEALDLIKSEVEEMLDQLEKNQVLKINKIGEFRLLNEHIIFKADDDENYLIDSFGLSSLGKEEKEEKEENTKIENTKNVEAGVVETEIENTKIVETKKVETVEEKSKIVETKSADSNQKNIRFLIIAVVLLLSGLAFYTMKDNIFKLNEKSSTVDTLLNQNDTLKLLEDSLNQISEQIDTATNIAPINSTANTENISQENSGNVTEIIDTSSTNTGTNVYCIASASFGNEKDAIAEKRQLEMIGFEAEIIAMKNATRYQVIIGKYQKYQDAVNELKFAKNIDKKFYLLTVKENK